MTRVPAPEETDSPRPLVSEGAQRRGDSSPPILVDHPQRGDARGLKVPHLAAAVPMARRAIVEDLRKKLDPDLLDEVAVVTSELLGNAILHARSVEGVVMIRWQYRGGTVDIEVTDGGAPMSVRPLRPGVYSTSGRGLRIVRNMAHEWGVTEEQHGRRTVWAALGGPSKRRRKTP